MNTKTPRGNFNGLVSMAGADGWLDRKEWLRATTLAVENMALIQEGYPQRLLDQVAPYIFGSPVAWMQS